MDGPSVVQPDVTAHTGHRLIQLLVLDAECPGLGGRFCSASDKELLDGWCHGRSKGRNLHKVRVEARDWGGSRLALI